jgi:hypothetical protein
MTCLGKTVLASMIVEECRKLQSTERTTLAFFYCDYSDSQRNTFGTIARGLLSQLVLQNGEFLPYMFEKYLASGETILESTIIGKELLEAVLTNLEKVYIIIDGLDSFKAEDKRITLSWFLRFLRRGGNASCIKCLFTSQDDGFIRNFLGGVDTIHVSAEDISQDIRSYASFWSERIQSKFDIPDTMREAILSNVVERANGETISGLLTNA